MPSSLADVKVYVSSTGKSKLPVQRAEKSSGPTPGGDPSPHRCRRGAFSQPTEAGVPDSVRFGKYSAR